MFRLVRLPHRGALMLPSSDAWSHGTAVATITEEQPAGGAAAAAAPEPAPVAAAPVAPVPDPEAVIRSIIPGKFAGSLIGKGGTTISYIRTQSNAKVNISDNNPTDERIVTVTGSTEGVFRAFSFICDKMRENAALENPASDGTITVRLAIPNSQVGTQTFLPAAFRARPEVLEVGSGRRRYAIHSKHPTGSGAC